MCLTCYNKTARTSGTAHNIWEISGSFSYVPSFITASLSLSGIQKGVHAIGLHSGISKLTT
jgi:hypothetical protein